MYLEPQYERLQSILKRSPEAYALVKGSPSYSGINGAVYFYSVVDGVLLVAQVQGLPQGTVACSTNIFGFHIHEGTACTGTETDPFANTEGHYNPKKCPHPAHAGDLPPLFGNHGYAFMAVITDRFTIKEIIGRTIIIHASPDDFTTQPSGNSGTKIACGQIVANIR